MSEFPDPTTPGPLNPMPSRPRREAVWQVAGKFFQRRAFWAGTFSFLAGLSGLAAQLNALPFHVATWFTHLLLILGTIGLYCTVWFNNLEAAQAAGRVMESLNAHQDTCPGTVRPPKRLS
jgi:hypothetical protein